MVITHENEREVNPVPVTSPSRKASPETNRYRTMYSVFFLASYLFLIYELRDNGVFNNTLLYIE